MKVTADFDGDELNLLRIPDLYFLEGLARLAPHLGVLDLQKPMHTNRENSLPGPLISTIGNWLYGNDTQGAYIGTSIARR